jgi:hypothetical protein
MSEFEQRQKAQNSLFTPATPDRAVSQPVHSENSTPAYHPLGNQAAQRFAQSCPLRLPSPSVCPFGGVCHTCPLKVQAKLKVNEPGDRYEQEADRVADQVMRMPEPRTVQRACSTCDEEGALQTKPLAEQITPLIQRQAEEEEEEEPAQAKLANDTQVQRQEEEPEEEEEETAQAKLANDTQVQRQEEEPEEEEEETAQAKLAESTQVQRQEEEPEEEEEPIQAKRGGGQTPRSGPGLTTQMRSLRGGGSPLPQSERDFFEPRFGYDFGQVRIHTNDAAATAASTAKARAFTVGQDVVFGAGQYTPGTAVGRNLVAHELAHVVQQNKSAQHSLQRRMTVEEPDAPLPGTPPKTKSQEVDDYIQKLSPSFAVKRSGTDTTVEPKKSDHCDKTPSRFTDRCLCDLHNSTNPEPWKIKIDDDDWPHTEEKNRRVTAHSTRSIFTFGSWGGGAQAGQRTYAENARVLGHELCGHAWLFELRIHPPLVTADGGRPSHDITVMIENRIAEEMYGPGFERRGTFSDPHHGESIARVIASQYRFGGTQVSDLPPDMQDRLRTVRDFMRKSSGVMADVIGHADHPTRNPGANISASKARARNVRNWLIGQGVLAKQFKAVTGRGDSECPAVPAGRNPDCRKVEIFLFGYEAASESWP